MPCAVVRWHYHAAPLLAGWRRSHTGQSCVHTEPPPPSCGMWSPTNGLHIAGKAMPGRQLIATPVTSQSATPKARAQCIQCKPKVTVTPWGGQGRRMGWVMCGNRPPTPPRPALELPGPLDVLQEAEVAHVGEVGRQWLRHQLEGSHRQGIKWLQTSLGAKPTLTEHPAHQFRRVVLVTGLQPAPVASSHGRLCHNYAPACGVYICRCVWKTAHHGRMSWRWAALPPTTLSELSHLVVFTQTN